ncbi:sigma 54-interacting transcriptional regulator [Silvibacterium acidisoli]|uniref:sigma 54-interacting transcriptional regulator n=1 Tax=Acidobacteriaceae bacterium ZG23-2 TaxID=2883246 RepID=UPI00406CD95B
MDISSPQSGSLGITKVAADAIIQAIPDGIVTVAASGTIAEVNPGAEVLFGYKPGEMIGLSIEALIPGRFRRKHDRLREHFQKSPQARPMGLGLNLLGCRKDGTEFPVDVLLTPIKTPECELTVAVVRDISDRKQIEESLRSSDERFRIFVESAQDYAMFILDPDGKVASWNIGAARMKGYTQSEILGQHFSRFYPPEEVERRKPDRELEVARIKGRCEDEGWRIRKNGSRFWANVVITALRGDKGELRGFSKVTRDLSKRKNAEDSLLTEITNAIVARSDLRHLLIAIGAGLERVVPHDVAWIALDFGEKEFLKIQELRMRADSPFRGTTLLPVSGTPIGYAYRTQQVFVFEKLDHAMISDHSLALFTSARVKSGLCIPLSTGETPLGALFFGSKEESGFEGMDLQPVLQVSNHVAVAIDHARALQKKMDLNAKLAEEKRYLEEELRTEYGFEEIIGENPGLKRVLKQVETVAPTDATVLIQGETGTGKELIARAIHQLSKRRERTFVKLNCSAIPLGLLESELFGHEKGAFTGAIAQKVGRLELAHMGTLFLDEIGDLPLELQPKILRALQEKEIERLGGRRAIPVDVRLIAATNRDLKKMIREGEFRNDLYYRLNVFPISLPALRDRREDIALLVNYFVAKHARKMNKSIIEIPEDAMRALVSWPWPGNVRELENFLQRAVILTSGSTLRVPLAELETYDETLSDFDASLENNERAHIVKALREAGGRIGGTGGAAEKLRVNRTTLNSKIKKLKIRHDEYM